MNVATDLLDPTSKALNLAALRFALACWKEGTFSEQMFSMEEWAYFADKWTKLASFLGDPRGGTHVLDEDDAWALLVAHSALRTASMEETNFLVKTFNIRRAA